MTKIDEVTENQLIADYKGGLFYRAIIRKYHVSSERLRSILQKHGVHHSRRPDYSNAPKEEIAKAYSSKTPILQICKKYKISRDALYDIVRETNAESRFRITPLDEETIINKYKSGAPLKEIEESTGFGNFAIYKVLLDNNVIRDRRISDTKINLEEAGQLYHDGMSLKEVGDYYGVDRGVVARFFNKRGVIRKTQSEACQIYEINQNYFSNPNKPDVAYFLGFLWADGCNKTYDNTLGVILNSKDEDILLKLRSALGSTHPIRHFDAETPSGKIGHYCDLNITNKVLSETLNNLGMVKAKTYAESMALPKGIDDDNTRHFLRGLIDGDGWIVVSKARAVDINVGVAGHADLLKILSDYILRVTEIKTTINDLPLWNPDICKTKGLYVNGNRNVVKFLQWLYKDSFGFRLDRKYEIYKNAIIRYFSEIKGAEKLSHLNFVHE